jgi:hypothetical protein
MYYFYLWGRLSACGGLPGRLLPQPFAAEPQCGAGVHACSGSPDPLLRLAALWALVSWKPIVNRPTAALAPASPPAKRQLFHFYVAHPISSILRISRTVKDGSAGARTAASAWAA